MSSVQYEWEGCNESCEVWGKGWYEQCVLGGSTVMSSVRGKAIISSVSCRRDSHYESCLVWWNDVMSNVQFGWEGVMRRMRRMQCGEKTVMNCVGGKAVMSSMGGKTVVSIVQCGWRGRYQSYVRMAILICQPLFLL